MRVARLIAAGGVGLGVTAGTYILLVRGALTLDLGVGRRTLQLGPLAATMHAPSDVVFDVIAGPYLGRTPQALADKLHVLERGTDMVIAEHFTPALGGRVVSTTVESVRFERPNRVSFRLLRGPVPLVTETFDLTAGDRGDTTEFAYRGELSTDLWSLGAWWGRTVARHWERAVVSSMQSIQQEAERRASIGT
jgi:hypothetical protein